MAGASTAQKGRTGHFARWARSRKHTSVDFPATRWNGPTRTLDTEERWDQARRLCSGACKAKAYRDRRKPGGSRLRPGRRSRHLPGMPGPSRSGRRPATLIGTLADAASGQQALIPVNGRWPPNPAR
jgi:hypothetical protein